MGPAPAPAPAPGPPPRLVAPQHPSASTNLASTYRSQGRWKEAEELFVQVMETRKRALGQEHPDSLTSMGNLASAFWNQVSRQKAGAVWCCEAS